MIRLRPSSANVLLLVDGEVKALLPQPVHITEEGAVVTVCSGSLKVEIDFEQQITVLRDDNIIAFFSPNLEDKRLLHKLFAKDPNLYGHRREYTLKNKMGFPVAWVKKGFSVPDITWFQRNPKYTRKELQNCIFKLGLHCTPRQLRLFLDSWKEDANEGCPD